jgi:hypothetical protein
MTGLNGSGSNRNDDGIPMKNKLNILIIFFVVSLFAGCTTTKEMTAEKKAFTGTLKVVGNEPFTSLALQTSAGKTYILQCPSNLRRILLNHQGYQTTVWYDSVKQTLNGHALYIIDADTTFTVH